MNSPSEKKCKFGLWPQWLAASELFLMGLMVGLIAGWSSPYLAKLSKEDSLLVITKDEASWFASLINISRPFGAILGAILVSMIGSKTSTLLVGIPFALGWSCFLIVNSVELIYASRILSGVGIGMFYSSFPLYIGEIANPKIRGALISLIMQGLVIGQLIGNIIGTYLDMNLFAIISLIPNLLFLITFYLMPKTPYYYVYNDKMDKAKSIIKWYNRNIINDNDNNNHIINNELDYIKQSVSKNLNKDENIFLSKLRELNKPVNRKSILIVNVIYAFLQLSGLYTVTAYAEIMLTNANVTFIKPSLLVIIVSVLGIISSWISMLANDKYGRVKMLSISSLGVAIAMLMWGINYQLLDLGYNNPNYQLLSILAAIIYQITMTVGLLPVPTTLMSEMFSPDIKSIAACITNITSALFAFAASKSYQIMVDVLTEKYVFWIYATLMVVLILYTVIYLPETKGKSLGEIQLLLQENIKLKTLNIFTDNSNHQTDKV